MDHKHLLLHELLQQDQEPFHLNTYISDKRSELNFPSPVSDLHLTKRSSAPPEATPCDGDFLLVPSRTAAVLVEAAMRIQKRRRSKHKTEIVNVGISLFGSFLKILKQRKNRVLRKCDLIEIENPKEIRVSCSCNLGPSTSTNSLEQFHEVGDLELHEARCSSARRSPELCSPAGRIKQEKDNSAELHNVKGGEEEQCSPVSVLDAFFEVDGEEEDHNREGRYASIERVRQQLLERLRRFEQLASLDLEQKLLKTPEFEDNEQPLLYKEGSETLGPRHSALKMLRGAKFSNIDKMVEADVKGAFHEWIVRSGEVVEELAAEIELAIFCGLVEEFDYELCQHGY